MKTPMLPLVAFNGAYLLAALAWALGHGNYEFLAYIAVVLVAAGVVISIHLRHPLSPALLWCLSVWGLLHMAGGLVTVPQSWPVGGDSHVLYNLWLLEDVLKFDQLVHAWGFAITTWLCWEGLRSMLEEGGQAVTPTVGKLVLCVAAGMGFGALNEVIEFTVTLLVPDTNVGGYLNNSLDLVFNMLGAILAALVIRWRYSTH
jgi:uncharacterized membrane protein YjdF